MYYLFERITDMNIKKFMLAAAAAVITLLSASAVYARGRYIDMELEYDGTSHHYNAEEIHLEINGREPADLPMPPILLNNYTLVPAREVFENLGADVEWMPASRQVYIYHENTTVVIDINSTTALVDNEEREMDIPAKIINNKTMIPLRFVSQAINKQVGWDNDTRTASVKDRAPEEKTTAAPTTQEPTTETTTVTTTIATTKEPTTAKPEKQDIEKIEFNQTPGADIISISGSGFAPDVNVIKSTDGKLLTIDMENGTLTAEKKDLGKGNFIKNGYYYQLSDKYIRVSIELESAVKYNITKKDKTTMIVLTENTGDIIISNEDYSYIGNNFSFENNKLIINNASGLINLKNVQYTDNYLNGEFIINIPANLTSVISSTSFNVKNDMIEGMDINTSSYGTSITIREAENSIIAVQPEVAGNYAVFKIVEPKEKYDKILVLDAGHGLQDNGASGNGLIEKDLTIDMVQKALKLFEDDGSIKVYCTRLGDTYPTLWERQEMASKYADVFVSVHINSAESSSPNGTETFCLYPNDQGNGLTSYMLAEEILNNLVDALDTYNRGVKSEAFVVLKGTKPSTLLEIGFISNPDDAEMMASDANRQKVAKAIFDGVKVLLDEYPPIR